MDLGARAVEGGTRVVHRRPVPKAVTLLSRAFAPAFLGGSVEHADELEQGMARTVAGLKAAAEALSAARIAQRDRQ